MYQNVQFSVKVKTSDNVNKIVVTNFSDLNYEKYMIDGRQTVLYSK